MKTIIRSLFIFSLLIFGAVSCIGLDTVPYDRESDLTFWDEDEGAALKALNTCYTYLASIEELMYSEAMTDNAYTKQPNDATQNIGNGSYSTADPYVRNVWNSRYTGIRMCNQLLKNIDRVPNLSSELKNRYIGERQRQFVPITTMSFTLSLVMFLIQQTYFQSKRVWLLKGQQGQLLSATF